MSCPSRVQSNASHYGGGTEGQRFSSLTSPESLNLHLTGSHITLELSVSLWKGRYKLSEQLLQYVLNQIHKAVLSGLNHVKDSKLFFLVKSVQTSL